MLKVGLVGVGGISGAHIPAWDSMEDISLTALCDIRPERMEAYPDKHGYTDFEEMLQKEELDILDICLPTYLHTDYALRAMERGIHVLCEKPISLLAEDVDRLYGTARRCNVRFMVAQVLRFWPEYIRLKDTCASGAYGRVLSGSMTRLGGIPKWSWDGWMNDEARSGLVPFDLHIHDLDFLVYAFGAPRDVRSRRVRRPEQDYISAMYEYQGFFVTAQASWFAAPYPFTAAYRFQFEHAILSYENGKCMLYQDDGSITDLTGAPVGDTGSINLPQSDAYANEIRYFADCVRNGHSPDIVRPEELRSVIELLKAL